MRSQHTGGSTFAEVGDVNKMSHYQGKGSFMFGCNRAAFVEVGAIAGVGIVVAPVASVGPRCPPCKGAARDGRYNIPRNDPALFAQARPRCDGIACES